MSVEKVAAELQRVLGLLDLANLTRALELVDQAEHGIVQATQGSQQPEVGKVVAQLGYVKQQLGQVHQQVKGARQVVHRYLANIADGGSMTTLLTKDNSATVPTTPPKSKNTGVTGDKQHKINGVLDTLPPEVPKPNPSGKKTHGKVVGSDEVIVSGVDEESAEVWQLLLKAGVPPRVKTMAVNHVEMKVAVRMIRSGNKNVELAINHAPVF